MQHLRVILVEDNPGDEALTRMDLERHADVDFTVAHSCNEFVRVVKNGEFDCALIDYHLPDGDADALLQVLRRVAPETPAIVLSGCSEQQIVTQTLRNGGADFISKNAIMGCDELWERVVRAVHVRQQNRLKRRLAEQTTAPGGSA